MFRKNYFTFLLLGTFLLALSSVAFAQTYPVSGRVMLKEGETSTPVAGASVEVFRDDSKVKLPKTKTDKKGYFAFAGLTPGYRYILSVSGPGIAPLVYPGVVAGASDFVISVSAGDGKQFTEEEVRSALKGQSTSTSSTSPAKTELTDDEKKAQAEQLKKIEEIKAKNTKIEQKNTIRETAGKEGDAAFNAKNYDLAIAKYEEGYQADTEFVSSAPVFLAAKARALSQRGVERFIKASKLTDLTVKIEEMSAVTKDFSDALEAFNTSWTILKNAPTGSITNPTQYETNKTTTLDGFRILLNYLVQTEKVESAKIPLAKTLITEYIGAQAAAENKLKAQISLADLYRIAGDSDNAVVEYRKALEMSPDNPDALAGLGLSLFNAGEINNNLAQKQEGMGYMERFATVAPDTHKLKASVAEAVTYLKSQNVKSTKVTTTKKTKP